MSDLNVMSPSVYQTTTTSNTSLPLPGSTATATATGAGTTTSTRRLSTSSTPEDQTTHPSGPSGLGDSSQGHLQEPHDQEDGEEDEVDDDDEDGSGEIGNASAHIGQISMEIEGGGVVVDEVRQRKGSIARPSHPATSSSAEGQAMGPKKTRIIIKDAAWSTWWAVLYWVRCHSQLSSREKSKQANEDHPISQTSYTPIPSTSPRYHPHSVQVPQPLPQEPTLETHRQPLLPAPPHLQDTHLKPEKNG